MSETPFGYILLEGENDIKEVKNLEVIEKPHLFYVRFDTVLQSLDCKNRNGRQYNGDAMVKGLSDYKISELIANNKWKGERDHPITKDINRIATVSSSKESHRITKWWRDGNLIKGTIETLDDGMYGTQLTRNILQGENPSFSLRALAVLDKTGTVVMVNRPPRVITYDEVNLPSHVEAYALPKKTKVISDGTSEVTYESAQVAQNGKVIAIEANDIKDMITRKSDNLKIVCESFDIDPSSLEVCNNGQSLSLKGGGEKFIFALENNIARDIANYYRM